jgi:hypothetical protein
MKNIMNISDENENIINMKFINEIYDYVISILD